MKMEPAPRREVPISPSLAVRVAAVGFIAFALFAIIFLRLWFLQVLSGDQYLAQATQNRVRVEAVQAPRGDIVDRNNDVLVENRQATVLRLKPASLPEAVRTDAATWGQRVTARARRPEGSRGAPVALPAVRPQVRDRYKAIGAITGLSLKDIQYRVTVGIAQVPYAAVRLKSDVPDAVRNYVEERQEDFPGVTVDQIYVRKYPFRSLASQLVGTVSEISPQQLEDDDYKGVKEGTIVGQEGLEAEYDRYLRGTDGRLITNVDAQGLARDDSSRTEAPTPGRQVQLSLDLGLQRTGERALARFGKPGAFVAMDPDSGEIHAIGSAPNFDPNRLSRPISQEEYDRLYNNPESNQPRFNRAISSVYPVGSTFKPVTAFAALGSGIIAPGSTVGDSTGCIQVGIGPGSERCNAGKAVLGTQDVVGALKVSSDVFFYRMGQRLYLEKGRALQDWARRLGLGRRTGVDLPNESKGNVPDRAYRDELNRDEAACRKRNDGDPCGIADGTNRAYSVGDNVSLAVGQGDFQATPLQMATAYAAIANGGKVVRPHLGTRVEDDQSRLVQRLSHGSTRRVSLPPADLAAIRLGLREAASAPGGTSTSVFAGWPQSQLPIYGKTGTAQTGNLEASGDQSWYVAYVPRSATNSRPLVVAATIERGGFGAAAAAPTACRILAKWYDRPDVPCTPGTNNDR